MRPRLLLDVDGVLVDFATPVFDYLARAGRPKERSQARSWDFFEGDVELEREFKRSVASSPSFCRELVAEPGAIDFARRALERYDVAVVTSPYDVPNWYDGRRDWLVRELGIDRTAITFTHQKEFVEGDIFIDDSVKNVARWHSNWKAKRPIVAIVRDQPWNQERLPAGVQRCFDWQDLSNKLELAGYPPVL